jgi:hypothetical protein
MKNKKYILTSMILLMSCMSKPVEHPCSLTYFDMRFNLNYQCLYFNKNSYWIYEDTISKTIDSVYVLNSDYKDFLADYCIHEYHLRTTNMYLYSSFYKDTISLINYRRHINLNPPTDEIVVNDIENSNFKLYGIYVMDYYNPYIVDSMKIKGKTYKDIRMRSSVSKYNFDYYFSMNVGYIRKTIVDTANNQNIRVWDLLRHNIEK